MFVVGQAFRGCLKTDYFTATSVGAVREPPEIRALLEAPLQGNPSFLGFCDILFQPAWTLAQASDGRLKSLLHMSALQP